MGLRRWDEGNLRARLLGTLTQWSRRPEAAFGPQKISAMIVTLARAPSPTCNLGKARRSAAYIYLAYTYSTYISRRPL